LFAHRAKIPPHLAKLWDVDKARAMTLVGSSKLALAIGAAAS
jgi:hypothetical protein